MKPGMDESLQPTMYGPHASDYPGRSAAPETNAESCKPIRAAIELDVDATSENEEPTVTPQTNILNELLLSCGANRPSRCARVKPVSEAHSSVGRSMNVSCEDLDLLAVSPPPTSQTFHHIHRR